MPSLNDRFMVEPTVVVAIAAALDSVGAAMEVKLTLFKAALVPPQADNNKLAPLIDDANGKSGAPAKVWSH